MKKRHKQLTSDLRDVTDKISTTNVNLGRARRRLARLNAQRQEIVDAIKADIPLGLVSVSRTGRSSIIQIEAMRPAMLAELIELGLKSHDKRIQIPRISRGHCSYAIPAGKSFEHSIHRRLNSLGCLMNERQIKNLPRASVPEAGAVFVSATGTVLPFLRIPSWKSARSEQRRCSVVKNSAGTRPVRYAEHVMPGCKVYMVAPAN